MSEWLLFSAAAIALLGGAVRDGISERAPGVGWTDWHVVTWLARETPVVLILVIFCYHGRYGLIIFLLILATLHDAFYRLGINLRPALQGSPEPPLWFKYLRRLWSWLPWV